MLHSTYRHSREQLPLACSKWVQFGAAVRQTCSYSITVAIKPGDPTVNFVPPVLETWLIHQQRPWVDSIMSRIGNISTSHRKILRAAPAEEAEGMRRVTHCNVCGPATHIS